MFGLKHSATPAEIKSAYRRLTRKYHPDYHNGDQKFQDAFAIINSIYSILSNNRKRLDYDYYYRRHIRMLWEHYNSDDFSENSYSLIPAGRYRVRIEDAEEATSHSGKNMIKLTLTVSGYRSKLWSYVVLDATTPEQVKATNRRLGSIFNSFGIPEGNMNLDSWRGYVGGAKIRHIKDANDNDRADVHYFLYRKEVDKLPAWQEAATEGIIDPDMMDFSDEPIGSSEIPF
ncbi:MAG: DnaJ domain-containing protein [Synergistaceae bacterium]|nr:DnaJ domain-containing protein [Synergistaceae bacterium]